MTIEELILAADLDCMTDLAMLADELDMAGRGDEAALLRAGPVDLFGGRFHTPFPGRASVLARGSHAGHDWLVAHNGMGYRCGYVRVGPGHPWHGKGYDDVPAEAHGGLTFAKAAADGGWWVGFDCAHAGDAQDHSLPTKYKYESGGDYGMVRTQEYAEAECASLCDQAASA
jgi:hypothetical protein